MRWSDQLAKGDVKSNGMQIGNKKHGGSGHMNTHKIVAYLKTCGMDPENVELHRSNLGGVHGTFYFDDDTIESTDSSTGSERSQDDHLYNSSKEQPGPPPSIWKLHKSPALVGIKNQNNRLLREWA